jgi:tetratricopeptide (TPR) repeat protein
MRQQMLQLLVDRLSADALLVSFQPNLLELEDVYDVYSRKNRPADMERLMLAIRDQSAGLDVAKGETLEGHEQYVPVLMKANRIAWTLKQHAVSQTLLRRAIVCDTAAEAPRRALGLLLMEKQQYEDAEKLFEWCYEQTPGDVRLEELRRECRRLRTQQRRLRTASTETPTTP